MHVILTPADEHDEIHEEGDADRADNQTQKP